MNMVRISCKAKQNLSPGVSLGHPQHRRPVGLCLRGGTLIPAVDPHTVLAREQGGVLVELPDLSCFLVAPLIALLSHEKVLQVLVRPSRIALAGLQTSDDGLSVA